MCNVHLFKSHTDLKQNQQYQERQCTFSDMLLIYAVHVCCLSHCPLLKEKRGRSYGTFICRLCLPSWYVVRSATISSHTILPERGTVRPWDLRSIEKKIYALNRGSLLCWRLIVGNSIGASCMDKVLAYCSFWVLSSCPMLEGSTNVQPIQKVDTSQKARTLLSFAFLKDGFQPYIYVTWTKQSLIINQHLWLSVKSNLQISTIIHSLQCILL